MGEEKPNQESSQQSNQSRIFQPQEQYNQLLLCLLIVLHFTPPLESKAVQEVIKEHTTDTSDYISRLKKRGWLQERNALIYLTEKAKRMVLNLPFANSISSLERRSGNRNSNKDHEPTLIKSLFLCLYHLDLSSIEQVKKQKLTSGGIMPDLSILTSKGALYIEIDTGKQSINTVEGKIRRYQQVKQNGTLIFFTNSVKNFNHFRSSKAQFIYLPSPSLLADIQSLPRGNLDRAQGAQNSAYPKRSPFISKENTFVLGNVYMNRQSYLKLLKKESGENDLLEDLE